MANISYETAERIRDAWSKATSLADAMRIAGLNSKDAKNNNRSRREAEKLLGIKLPTINAEFSTETEISCPSSLDRAKAKKAKAFVITTAINNANINSRFFDTLELFAETNSAQLLVIPQKYKHNTLAGGKDYAWSDRVHPYALTDDLIVNKSLVISALNLQATAVRPLSGLSANSGERSAIYGATKVALESVPTPGNRDAKVMMTTGACTARKYTKTKAGGKAKFHHSFSALYVRIVGDKFFATQLHWSGSCMYYLDEKYTPEGVTGGHRVEALVQGDSHAAWADKKLLQARKRLMKRIDPKALIWHDLHDHRYGNHHNSMLDKVKLAEQGMVRIEDELQLALDMVEDFGKGRENLFPPDNHGDALDRHINRFDADKDPINAMLMWDLARKVVQSGKSAFQCWLEPKLTVKAKFLDSRKEHLVKGIDVSQHGHAAGNGARGSIVSFGKFSRKTFTGHSHSPGISGGAYQVGVSTKSMGYQKGYSSWSLCDGLIYPDGKRALIFYTDYKSLCDL